MKSNNRRIIQQSSEWMERLKYGSAADREAFSEWLLQSELHVRHFLMMSALDEELRHVDRERLIKVETEDRDSADIVPLIADDRFVLAAARAGRGAGDSRAFRFAGRQLGWWSLAFAVVAVGLLLVLTPRITKSADWQEYQTGLGEQRSFVLGDGSVIQLNTRSQVAARLTDSVREVRMVSGEALFKVRHDDRRSFDVFTRGARVRATGTEFNVYQRAEDTAVTVMSGSVQVSPQAAAATGRDVAVRLSAGERTRVNDKGEPSAIERVDAQLAKAWTTRELIFSNDTLGHMVDEFNRYNAVQFRLVGSKVAQRLYAGRFQTNEPEVFAELLKKDDELDVQQLGNSITVRERRTGANAVTVSR